MKTLESGHFLVRIAPATTERVDIFEVGSGRGPSALVSVCCQLASVAPHRRPSQIRRSNGQDLLPISTVEAGAHAVKLQFAHGFQNLVAFHQAIYDLIVIDALGYLPFSQSADSCYST